MRISVGHNVVVRRGQPAARRIKRLRQFVDPQVSLPIILVGLPRYRQQTVPAATDGSRGRGNPSDVPVGIRIDKIQARNFPTRQRRHKLLAILGSGDRQTRQIRSAPRFAPRPLQRDRRVTRFILVHDWTMPRESKFQRQWFTATTDANRLVNDPHRFPAIPHAILTRVVGMGALDEQIGLVGPHDGEAPCDAVVVSQRHARKCRLTAADDVPARRMQMDQIAQRRECRGTVRVARQKRLAGGGEQLHGRPNYCSPRNWG